MRHSSLNYERLEQNLVRVSNIIIIVAYFLDAKFLFLNPKGQDNIGAKR